MDLTTYIILIVFLFFIVVGGYHLFNSLRGPRKIDEILKLIEQGRIRDAQQQLLKILEKDDRDIMARYLLARCYRKEGNHNAAILELRQCIKIGRFGPGVEETAVRNSLAESLLEVGNRTEAKNEFLILTTIEPDNFKHFFNVGKLFHTAGIHPKAIHFLTKAVALNPRHAESQALLGQSHYSTSSYHEAKDALSKAVQVDKENTTARYFLGLALRYLGDLEWALKELEQAERDDGLKARAILAKGMIYIDQEGYPKAITELQRGLKFAPKNGETAINMHYLLALASERVRDLHTAIQNWEKIESIKPGYRDVKEKLKQYADFRTDDAIKDFLIASVAQFEGVCKKIVENFSHQILNVSILDDSRVRILAIEEDAKRRAATARNQNTLFSIQRDMSSVTEQQVRDFMEQMKQNNAGRGYIMTTGEISPGALNYASSRPIDLFDSSRIVEPVRSAMYS